MIYWKIYWKNVISGHEFLFLCTFSLTQMDERCDHDLTFPVKRHFSTPKWQSNTHNICVIFLVLFKFITL